MSRIRLMTLLFLLSNLLAPVSHAQDRLSPCSCCTESKPGDNPVFVEHIPGELALWVEWGRLPNRYVIAVSRDRGAVWITMVDKFIPYWDPDILPPEEREAAIERAPKPRTNVYKERISEALAQELSLAWSEWLSETPGESGIGRDGVTYMFRKIDQCRQAWSPDPGTENDMRVTLVDMLSQLAQGKKSYPPVNEERRIEDWLKRIRFEP